MNGAEETRGMFSERRLIARQMFLLICLHFSLGALIFQRYDSAALSSSRLFPFSLAPSALQTSVDSASATLVARFIASGRARHVFVVPIRSRAKQPIFSSLKIAVDLSRDGRRASRPIYPHFSSPLSLFFATFSRTFRLNLISIRLHVTHVLVV